MQLFFGGVYNLYSLSFLLLLINDIRFHESIEGGENFFVDMHHVAHKMREKYPEHFDTLTKVPISVHTLDYKRYGTVNSLNSLIVWDGGISLLGFTFISLFLRILRHKKVHSDDQKVKLKLMLLRSNPLKLI